MVLPHGTDNRTVNVYTHGLIAEPMNPFEMHEPVKLHKLSPFGTSRLDRFEIWELYLHEHLFYRGFVSKIYITPTDYSQFCLQPSCSNFSFRDTHTFFERALESGLCRKVYDSRCMRSIKVTYCSLVCFGLRLCL